jgi:hypothetical protein
MMIGEPNPGIRQLEANSAERGHSTPRRAHVRR